MDESHFTRSGQRKLIDLPLKRGRKKKPLQDDASTSGCTSNVAPTAALSSRKTQEVIDREKSKAELKIAELSIERDELLEKLSLAKRNVGPVITDSYTEPSSTDSSSSSSTSRSTSSDSSTSTEKHKKNRKGKNKKEKKRKMQKRSKKRHKTEKICQRARDPDEVVRRYRAVLKHYKKTKSFVSAYKAVGVDRNTIVSMAPIAELAITDPPKFEELASDFTQKEKLADFAKRCSVAISDPDVQQKIEQYKNALLLL